MAQITVNIDQSIKRQAEAVLEVYGQTMEGVFTACLENIIKTGEIPKNTDETNPLYGEEIPGEFDWFDETEEEFFAKLEEAERNFDAGLGIPIDEFFAELFEKLGIEEKNSEKVQNRK